MKTKLSRYWWTNLFFLTVVGLIAEGTMLWFIVYTSFDPETITFTYLFGKEICRVSKDRMIYYAIVEFEEHLGFEQRYIAISNFPFVLKEKSNAFIPLKSNRFIDYYDKSKQILYRYDATVAATFPIDKWVCVGKQASVKD